jgi:hypothetical protein
VVGAHRAGIFEVLTLENTFGPLTLAAFRCSGAEALSGGNFLSSQLSAFSFFVGKRTPSTQLNLICIRTP